MFTVNYDENILALEDACVFTYEKEVQISEINEAGITVVSIVPGKIQFRLTESSISAFTGVINCMKFKGLIDTTTSITIYRE